MPFRNILILLCFCAVGMTLHAQILIDEDFGDWSNSTLAFDDPVGDNNGHDIDLQKFWISNDPDFLFMRIQIDAITNLQSGNDLAIYIDTDNNITTGFPIAGIGAEIRYFFGSRSGFVHLPGLNEMVFHSDLDLTTLPTVSASEFEIAFGRNNQISGQNLNMGTTVRIVVEEDVSGGDQIPNQNGGVVYEMKNVAKQLSPYMFNKPSSEHLRIMSFNALQDGPFEPSRRASFERMIKAINPDIIGFQEIYDHGSSEVESFLESIFIGENWYVENLNPDIFTASRFPIIQKQSIDGNGAFKIQLSDRQLTMINAHLPCCENEEDRQKESDHIMSFLRDAKAGQGNFVIQKNDPIVILGDMNLVGGQEPRQTLITGNIINENIHGPDFHPDWDGTDLKDLKMYATGLPMAVTWIQPFSSFGPGRLDYILFSDAVMQADNGFSLNTNGLTASELQSTGIFTWDGANASDHLACIADFTFDLTSSVSTLDAFLENVNIYPVPASQYLTLSWEQSESANLEVTIEDVHGRKVRLMENHYFGPGRHEEDFQLANLPSGVYFVAFNSKRGIVRYPIIKQ